MAPSELRQKTDVVIVEMFDIVDAVLDHGDPLDPHAEGKPGDLLGIVPHVPEDLGVDLPGPEDLEPACLLADAAALALAYDAADVDFRGGLGEGKVAGPEPDRDILAEH